MSRIAREVSEDQGNVLPLEYQYLLSTKSRELLHEKGLTVEVTEQEVPYAIWQPFSFAGFTEYFPETNHDYGQDHNGNTVDRHNIDSQDIGATIAETVSKVFARLNVDTVNTHWWAIYTHTKTVGGINRTVFTSDSNNLPLSGAKLAGFAFKVKETPSISEDVSNKEWNDYTLAELESALIPVEAWTNGELLSITIKYKGQSLGKSMYCDKSVEFFDYKIDHMIDLCSSELHRMNKNEDAA